MPHSLSARDSNPFSLGNRNNRITTREIGYEASWLEKYTRFQKHTKPVVVCAMRDHFMGLADQNHRTETVEKFSEQLSKVESVYLIMFSTPDFNRVSTHRAAVRFWDCRQAWGNMVIYSRCLADCLIVRAEEVEMDCNKIEDLTLQIVQACDDCVAWCAAFAVSSKQFLRGIDYLSKEELLGVLSEDDVNKLQKAPHQPMFCYAMMRRCSRGLRDV